MNSRNFDELAPAFVKDAHQCNSRCKSIPCVGRIGDRWAVGCFCSFVDSDTPINVLRLWNAHNPIKRLLSAAQLSARQKALADLKK